ncbi:pyrethroid hydrolase Ces2e-like [Antechinus flavipes]|uniref:pyrethroid hydrolase Ces2e-like n=1 Tax=Antechinus flavipes TaxID=38775 RepID=UPI0022364AE0|nr:pyrethroid hydrolase Ces2e-like [Antechinus flavipes]
MVIQGIEQRDKADDPIRSTEYGEIRGTHISFKSFDKGVNVFLGIPFARPPIGALRFSPPQPPEPWSKVKNATSYPPMCLQDINILERLRKSLTINFSIPATSEDCLYLNIYVPDHAKEGSRLPVMVWIHGGHFLFGSASMYDGSLLSASQNIVVVTIQFRLGLLGFFSTEDKHTSGNWGYLDQVAAQRWIQENIGHFGGDPGLVAIFDESIGGINASSHVLSPMSKAFLYRTIKERDVTIQPGLISSRSESITRVIAHLSACEKYSSVSLVECLRNKTEREILAISKYFKIIPGEINGQFFPKHPEDPLASIKFHQGSSVINVNSNEYGSIIPVSLGITKFKEISRDNIRQILLNPFMGIRPYDVDTMMYLYLWNFEDPKELQAQFQEMLGDLELPALRVARYQQSPSSPVYFYAFQQGAIPFGSIKSNYVEVDYGVELLFVFGAFLHGPAAYEQKLFSVNTIIFWANFVRNRPAVLADPKPNEDYPLLPVVQGLRAEKMKFWLKDLLQKKKGMSWRNES